MLEWLEAFIHLLLAQSIHLADEIEIFFGGEVVDEETIVNKLTRYLLPVLAFAYINVIDGYISVVCLQQI